MKTNGQYVQSVKRIVHQGHIIAGRSDVVIQMKSKPNRPLLIILIYWYFLHGTEIWVWSKSHPFFSGSLKNVAFYFKNTKQVFKKLYCLSRQRNNFCSQQEGLHKTLIKWNIWTIPTPAISMMPKSHIFAPLYLHHCSARGGGLIIPFFLSKIAGALTTWAKYSIESLIKASSLFFLVNIYIH